MASTPQQGDPARLRHGRHRVLAVDAQVFRDPTLSATAKGVYGLLSILPEGEEFSPESLAAGTPDSAATVQAALDELAALGYLAEVAE